MITIYIKNPDPTAVTWGVSHIAPDEPYAGSDATMDKPVTVAYKPYTYFEVHLWYPVGSNSWHTTDFPLADGKTYVFDWSTRTFVDITLAVIVASVVGVSFVAGVMLLIRKMVTKR